MGTADSHWERGTENESIASILLEGTDAGSVRWAVIAAHYAAHEYAHSVLASSRAIQDHERHPESHGKTRTVLTKALPGATGIEIMKGLHRLQVLSNAARYLRGLDRSTSWWRAEHVSEKSVADEAFDAMRKIRQLVEAETQDRQ